VQLTIGLFFRDFATVRVYWARTEQELSKELSKEVPMNGDLSVLLSKLAKEDYCYLSTKGRISGRLHEIEIWFVAQGTNIYLLSGGGDKSDWVKNLLKDPNVTVRIAKSTFIGSAYPAKNQAEDSPIRYAMAEKYQEWENGRTLSEWARTSLVVEIELKSLQTN
jgi:deazaflavin-dependent oxidoreductase (nitroreductase family)